MKRKVFNIGGGIGRCISATGVIKKYIAQHKDEEVYVVTGYPEIFFNVDGIKRVYPFNTPYLFEDVIKHAEYVEPEPYTKFEYYNQKKHITACFNKEINNCDDPVLPDISYSSQELASAKKFVTSHKKPVVLFQPYGSTGGRQGLDDKSKRSLRPEFVEKLCNELKKDYDVYLIKSSDQQGVEGINSLNNSLRQVGALIPHVSCVIGVDSFLQHACAQFDTKTIVFWGATRVENLGYDKHVNYSNGHELYWSPIRMISNDLEQDFKNEGIDLFDDKYIQMVIDEIGTKK